MITDLLLEATSLMLIGMATVFAFLLVLVLLMSAMSAVLRRFTVVKVAENVIKSDISSGGVSPAVVAAISAAVHQYRQQHK